jgi:hypothetical protein
MKKEQSNTIEELMILHKERRAKAKNIPGLREQEIWFRIMNSDLD